MYVRREGAILPGLEDHAWEQEAGGVCGQRAWKGWDRLRSECSRRDKGTDEVSQKEGEQGERGRASMQSVGPK